MIVTVQNPDRPHKQYDQSVPASNLLPHYNPATTTTVPSKTCTSSYHSRMSKCGLPSLPTAVSDCSPASSSLTGRSALSKGGIIFPSCGHPYGPASFMWEFSSFLPPARRRRCWCVERAGRWEGDHPRCVSTLGVKGLPRGQGAVHPPMTHVPVEAVGELRRLCVCVCVCAVSYTHLTLPTRR